MSVNPQLLELCRQGTDPAVTRAIHEVRPEDIHRRLPYDVACDLCDNWLDRMRELAAANIDFDALKDIGLKMMPAEDDTYRPEGEG